MASSDDDDQMLNKVENIQASTAPEHVVCQLCDEVFPEDCKSISVGLFGMQDVGQTLPGRVEATTTTHVGESKHESQSEAMQG